MITYTEKVLKHFLDPQNVGSLPDANGVGQIGDPACGDFLKIWIKVKDEIISDISFKCMGCPAAIATSSALTTLAKGRTIFGAMAISDQDVIQELDSLPISKEHCSNLGSTALKMAIADYSKKYILEQAEK